MMYIRLRTGLECQGRVEHWKRHINGSNAITEWKETIHVSDKPSESQNDLRHITLTAKDILYVYILCVPFISTSGFFFFPNIEHCSRLQWLSSTHPYIPLLSSMYVCVCARCFPPLSQSMPNHIKSLIKLFWGSNSKSYRRCVSGNMQHLFSPFSFFASAHLWLMQRQRIASRKSNTCWFDYCLQIMQIKGCVTNAQGWPTLHSWWGLILRASGLHLAVHSTVCTQMFAFWNYTLEPNHAYMQSAGTSPASIFTDICKSISVVSLFIRDLHIKILRWN